MMLAEGDTIGRYRVVRLLGTGGMGTVYEVERMDGGGRYALLPVCRARVRWNEHCAVFRKAGLPRLQAPGSEHRTVRRIIPC